MNKIILGSILVTVMSGVPGATYIITRDTSAGEKGTLEQKEGDISIKSPDAEDSGDTCPQENQGNCPKKEVLEKQ